MQEWGQLKGTGKCKVVHREANLLRESIYAPKAGKWGSAHPGAPTTATAASLPSNSEIPPGSEQRGGLHLATFVFKYMHVYIYSTQGTDIHVERIWGNSCVFTGSELCSPPRVWAGTLAVLALPYSSPHLCQVFPDRYFFPLRLLIFNVLLDVRDNPAAGCLRILEVTLCDQPEWLCT